MDRSRTRKSASRRGRPARRANYRTRWRRLRHHSRAPQLRRSRPRPDQLPGFPRIHRRRDALEGGVLLCFGSAVMGPEVYSRSIDWPATLPIKKAGRSRRFTTGVFDLVPLDGDTRKQAPKTDPRYYYRPWKTILVRTVADGGKAISRATTAKPCPICIAPPLETSCNNLACVFACSTPPNSNASWSESRNWLWECWETFLDRYLDIDASLNEPSVETGLMLIKSCVCARIPARAGTGQQPGGA